MIEIDPKIRNQFTENIFNKALEIFINTNGPLVEELSVKDKDEEHRILHKLKGGANMLGLVDLSSHIDFAEQNPGNSENLDQVKTSFSVLKEYFGKSTL